MTLSALLLLAVIACAQELEMREQPLENTPIISNSANVNRIPYKNCMIHYECKHYKWFCYRSEYAFCIEGTCKCLPRYHFGFRHPYRMYRD